MSTRIRRCSLEFLLLVAACADPSSEAGDGDGSGESTAADTEQATASDGETGSDTENCGMHVLASYDDDCQGLGSVRDLFDVAAGERTSTLAWSTFASEEITHTPNTGSTGVTVLLGENGGEAICHHYCDPCPGLPCGAAGSPARIDVDATLEITSEDGALAETVDVTASFDGSISSVAYAGSIAPADLQGTLEVQLVDGAFSELSINVAGVIDAGVSTGALSGIATQGDPMGPAVTAPIATWPMP